MTGGDRKAAALRAFGRQVLQWTRSGFALLQNTTADLFLLAFLMTVFLGPIFFFVYAFIFLDVRAAAVDGFVGMAKFYGSSKNYKEIWTILAPLLFAFSAGVSLTKGITSKSVVLFIIFFFGYMAADICSLYAADENYKLVLTDRDQINMTTFKQYCDAVGTLCVTGISIVLGLASASIRKEQG